MSSEVGFPAQSSSLTQSQEARAKRRQEMDAEIETVFKAASFTCTFFENYPDEPKDINLFITYHPEGLKSGGVSAGKTWICSNTPIPAALFGKIRSSFQGGLVYGKGMQLNNHAWNYERLKTMFAKKGVKQLTSFE